MALASSRKTWRAFLLTALRLNETATALACTAARWRPGRWAGRLAPTATGPAQETRSLWSCPSPDREETPHAAKQRAQPSDSDHRRQRGNPRGLPQSPRRAAERPRLCRGQGRPLRRSDFDLAAGDLQTGLGV